MNPFGRRTDEELAELLYGRGKAKSKLPPTGTPEAAIEEGEPLVEEPESTVEEPDEELELEESSDGKGLQPKGALGMIAGDDRLMAFLEEDIDRLDAEAEKDRQQADKNWSQKP